MSTPEIDSFTSSTFSSPTRVSTSPGGRCSRVISTREDQFVCELDVLFTHACINVPRGPLSFRTHVGTHSTSDARAQSATVRLRALGRSHDTIRFALGRGLRLVGNSHLLTTGPFGRLECYAPSGPTLF